MLRIISMDEDDFTNLDDFLVPDKRQHSEDDSKPSAEPVPAADELTLFSQNSLELLNRPFGEKKVSYCAHCGQQFANRSAKQYHKKKNEACNKPDVLGRPRKGFGHGS